MLLLLAALYLLGEALAVAGWRSDHQPYSWTEDTISALGVPGRTVADGSWTHSTRAHLMGATFVGSGLRVLLAAAVLVPLLPRWRWPVGLLAAVHGAGTVVVGLAPDGPTADEASAHLLGAVLAITGGGLVLLVLAVALTPVRRGLAGAAGVLGVTSLVGATLFVTGVGPAGLTERVAVDAVIAWQLLAGAVLLTSRSRT